MSVLPSRVSPLSALFLLVLLGYAFAQAGVNCPGACRFQFCGTGDATFVGVPNTVFGSRICRRNDAIGNILSVGETLVTLSRARRVPISQWKPNGLSNKFPKKYFSVASAPVTRGKSVIVRRTSKGNQNRFVNNQCFSMPIRRFERLANGRTVTVSTNGDARDCVAFRPRAPDVVIQVIWFSGDDLDLEVREPKGKLITSAPREDRSRCGMHGGDSGVDSCGLFLGARERVQFDRQCKGFQRGTYTAVVRHTTNCDDDNSATPWELSLTVGGRTVRTVKGSSNRDLGKIVTSVDFDL